MLTTLELKNMVSDELQKAGVFADKAFNFREDVKTEETTLRLKAKAVRAADAACCLARVHWQLVRLA